MEIKIYIAQILAKAVSERKEFINILESKIEHDDIDTKTLACIALTVFTIGSGSNKMLNYLIKAIYDKSIDIRDRREFVSILDNIEQDDVKTVDLFLELIGDNSLEKELRVSIVYAFESKWETNIDVLNRLFELINNRKLEEEIVEIILRLIVRFGTLEQLMLILENDYISFKNLVHFISYLEVEGNTKLKDALLFKLHKRDTHFIVKAAIAIVLKDEIVFTPKIEENIIKMFESDLLQNDDDYLLLHQLAEALGTLEAPQSNLNQLIILIIKNQNIDIESKKDLLLALPNLKNIDIKLFEQLKDIFYMDTTDKVIKGCISFLLVEESQDNREAIDALIDLVECQENDDLIREMALEILSSLGVYAYEKFADNKVVKNNFTAQLTQNTKLSKLFKMYDGGMSNITDYFVFSTINHGQALYVKNNKFYTVEAGTEISTYKETVVSLEDSIKNYLLYN
ncbi:MAG: Unknown protein [uncultured Sulfurovum sp.]|uniref:HEAT repeat domain-containing protein n=1 Tax=uncultured Sulfurovum sp. TaxID=269237 RepID=A0A6S6T330_9BACT|nr:MAG: Unknown protein [uncultured Sulfurovum sp.]